MRKKVIAIPVLVGLSFLINWKIGLVVSAAAILYGVYRLIPTIYIRKGNEAYANKDLNGAIKWFKKAAESKSASNQHRLGYALLLMRAGRFETSEAILNGVARDKSAKPEDRLAAREYRAMNYAKQGRLDEAMEEAQDFFADVKNTITYGIMGYFMHITGEPAEDTLKLCLEAYDYNADDRDIADNLALAYIRAGKNAEAAELADKIIEKNPEFVEGYYHGAQANIALGNRKKAKEQLSHISACNRTSMTTVSEEEVGKLAEELKNA